MAKAAAPSARIYTTRDQRVEHALATATATGLVDAGASSAQKLHALVVYADELLTAEAERAEKLAAYRELAQDDERLEAIRASSRLAVEHGLL
ncbi:hypothetical protein [Baekduia sp.]|uniref:hypothetical protein n=1 Tax=Baekduia sp. TaxID=2600305 RepID=UPI002DFE75F4|nr:hypothetical protein [Baekduia sp.]